MTRHRSNDRDWAAGVRASHRDRARLERPNPTSGPLGQVLRFRQSRFVRQIPPQRLGGAGINQS